MDRDHVTPERYPFGCGWSGTEPLAVPPVKGIRTGLEGVSANAGRKAVASPDRRLELDIRRTALVVVDPLSDGAGRKDPPVRGQAAAVRNGTIRNLARLLEASKRAGITVAVSLTRPAARASSVDFEPRLAPFIDDGETFVCRPPGLCSDRINDVGFRLRRLRIDQIVLAGVIDTLPIVPHLRDLAEQGFDVAVVRDAVVGAKLPEAEGDLRALVRFSGIARAVWTTCTTIEQIGGLSA